MNNVFGYVTEASGGRQFVVVDENTDHYIPEGTYVVIVPLTKPQPADLVKLYAGLCEGYEHMFNGALESMRKVRDKLKEEGRIGGDE